MQCWGDAPTGPDPEACQWGGFDGKNLPTGPNTAAFQDERSGSKCPSGGVQCDPAEPSKPDRQSVTDPLGYYVPFTPVGNPDLKIYLDDVDPNDLEKESLRTYYQAQSTNEVPVAATSSDGTGQVSFEMQTGRQASGLGCGDRDPAAGGAPRGCWLVIVPRGVFAPDGTPKPASVEPVWVLRSPRSARATGRSVCRST
ncbi:hypothetical protein ACFQ1L_09650 [Phytohabitans flavus]|uniref:hypothetical protein n=1 Tax=Phytohabitans flavus TaxID=1076124 RepID=UPI0036426325